MLITICVCVCVRVCVCVCVCVWCVCVCVCVCCFDILQVKQWSKSDSEDIYFTLFILKCIMFLLSNNQRILKIWIMIPMQILISTNVFDMYNNKILLDHQISTLKWFLKDHGTLKTQLIQWKFSTAITEINFNLNIIKLEYFEKYNWSNKFK